MWSVYFSTGVYPIPSSSPGAPSVVSMTKKKPAAGGFNASYKTGQFDGGGGGGEAACPVSGSVGSDLKSREPFYLLLVRTSSLGRRRHK